MTTTSKKLRSIGTKVTEEHYQALLALMDGQPPSEWTRHLLLAQLTTEPTLDLRPKPHRPARLAGGHGRVRPRCLADLGSSGGRETLT
jgi:hypothetical protein